MIHDGRTTPRFGGIDALILGASVACAAWFASTDLKAVEVALGLPEIQTWLEDRPRRAKVAGIYREAPPVGRFEQARWALVDLGEKVLPCLTLGVALATFRHRECWSRRALRHVGVLTTAVAGVFVAYQLGGEFAFRKGWPGAIWDHLPLGFALYQQGVDTCLATSALWGVLAIGKRWKATPDWPDRLGRAIGWGWIAFAMLGVLLQYAGLVAYHPDGARA